MRKRRKEYAIYKGDNLLAIGSLKEVSEALSVSENTIKFYTTPSHKKRVQERKNPYNARIAIIMYDEDEDECDEDEYM